MKDEALKKLRELQDFNISKKKFDSNIEYIEKFIVKSSEPKILTPKKTISTEWLQQKLADMIEKREIDSSIFLKINKLIFEYEVKNEI